MRIRMRRAWTALLVCCTAAFSSAAAPVEREVRVVTVDGVAETWRLVWTSPPVVVCGADEIFMAVTCPCDGFAYGEAGDLSVERRIDDRIVDRIPLTPLFGVQFPDVGPKAIVSRFEPGAKDRESHERDTTAFLREVRRREPVRIMQLRDYDHDGRKTEFYLQVATSPCGKRRGVVVGVSRHDPKLHVFSETASTGSPLLLRDIHWELLAESVGPVRSVDWPCLDHGSETETEAELEAVDGRIRVRWREFACDAQGRRGAEVQGRGEN